MEDADDEDVLVRIARTPVTGYSLRRLQPREWLDNEVINASRALMLQREDAHNAAHAPGRGRRYVFNSFFFSLLSEEAKGYDYERVRRWTKRAKLDIRTAEMVLIPVNIANTHWTLACIDFVEKRILYLDSMNGKYPVVFRVLRRWIVDEMKDKHGEPVDLVPWRDVYARCAQQDNAYDCGVYVCQNMNALLLGAELGSIRTRDMPHHRRRVAHDLLTEQLQPQKRARWIP